MNIENTNLSSTNKKMLESPPRAQKNIYNENREYEHLKYVVEALRHKLMASQSLKEELENTQEYFTNSEKARTELTTTIREISEKHKNKNNSVIEQLDKLAKENSQLRLENGELNIKYSNLNAKYVDLDNTQNLEIENLKREIERLKGIEEEKNHLFIEINRIRDEKDSLNQTYLISLNEINKERKTFELKYLGMKNENDHLIEDVTILKGKLGVLESEKKANEVIITNLGNEILTLKKMLAAYELKEKDFELRKVDYQGLVKEYEKIKQLLLEYKKNMIADKNNYTQQMHTLKFKIEEQTINIQELLIRINNYEIQLEDLNKQKGELENIIGCLETLVCGNEDLAMKLDTSHERHSNLLKEKELLVNQLNIASDEQQELEGNRFKQEEKVAQLAALLEEYVQENTFLKQYLNQCRAGLKSYHPASNDPIDAKLAEYLNSIPEGNHMKILFVREREGIYLFGTKRINVKVEMDKIIIRVGGGFLSLDEFLEIYTPIEMERIRKTDDLNKLSQKIGISII